MNHTMLPLPPFLAEDSLNGLTFSLVGGSPPVVTFKTSLTHQLVDDNKTTEHTFDVHVEVQKQGAGINHKNSRRHL